jgi:hypothetical protein
MNMSRWGLKPAGDGKGHLDRYLQKFSLSSRRVVPESSNATINGQQCKIGDDFIVVGASGAPAPFSGTASGNLVFVGHGLKIKAKNIDPYQGVDVRGKIMVVADARPKGFNFRDMQGKSGVDFDWPETYATAQGASGIIFLPSSSTLSFWEQRYKSSISASRPRMEREPEMRRVPAITISEKIATSLFQGEKLDYEAIKKQLSESTFTESFDLTANKQANFTVGAKVDSIYTQNVVAILEGSDPVLKNEYIAVGAHYDHVGIGGCRKLGDDNLCNGADDDGSGCGPCDRRSLGKRAAAQTVIHLCLACR